MSDVIRLASGIHQDNSKYEQPKGSYLFALNAILDADGHIGNENSIKEVTRIPEGMCIIGKVYIGNEDIALFLASDDMSRSEIGIFHTRSNTYTTHVDDAGLINQLNFKKTHQIDAVYRLRRGCERTVYFTDNLNKPRKYCFDRPEKFKTNGQWDIDLFDLQRKHKSIPDLHIDVEENGGSLYSGMYQIGIQYLDADKNAGEWITLSKPIYIYVDNLSNTYEKIEGSIHTIGEDVDYQNYPRSNKGIKITSNNLDKTYPFYRLCIAEYNNGHGGLVSIKTTTEISTETKVYVYTGLNYAGEISREELNLFKNIISKAKNITQLDNKLYLSNLEGKQINYCNLQKYASRIVTDCVLSENIPAVDVSHIGNSKNPTHEVYLKGYTPGEIYSFGIVYLFEDNSVSPVYHIPGRVEPFNPDGGYYPGTKSMDSYLNKTTRYIEKNTCNTNYWGEDHLFNKLSGTPVRHHKFPSRGQLGISFINQDVSSIKSMRTDKLVINIVDYSPSIEGYKCEPTWYHKESYNNISYFNVELVIANSSNIRDIYNNSPQTSLLKNTIIKSLSTNGYYRQVTEIEPEQMYPELGDDVDILYRVVITGIRAGENKETTTYEYYTYIPEDDEYYVPGRIRSKNDKLGTRFIGYSFNYSFEPVKRRVGHTQDKLSTSYNLLGVKFSNIILPDEDFIGTKVVGFYIVRQECTQEDSMVIDSAVLLPVVQSESNKNFYGHGLLSPEFESTLKTDMVSKKYFAFISPQHKFLDIQNKNIDRIVYHGSFLCKSKGRLWSSYEPVNWYYRTKYYGWVVRNDVLDGSSIDGVEDINTEMDDKIKKDGWSFCLASRSMDTVYVTKKDKVINVTPDIKIDYLSALDYCVKNDKDEPFFYNLSGDNKVGFLRFDKAYFDEPLLDSTDLGDANAYPYVTFEKDVKDPYDNFITRPYYREHTNPMYFGQHDTVELFSGDSNIGSMVYNSSCFIANQLATTATKNKSIWYYIGAGAVLLAGVLGAVFTGGSSLVIAGAILSSLAASAYLTASGLKYDALQRALNGHYNEGLKECLRDDMTNFWFYKDEDIEAIDRKIGVPPRGIDKVPASVNRFREKVERVHGSFFFDREKGATGDNGLSDDAICWVTESINNLWFETKVPIQLRSRMTNNLPSFVQSPADISRGNDYSVYYGVIEQQAGEDVDTLDISKDRDPVNNTEQHAFSKLLTFDKEKNKFQYNGFVLGEYYFINPDYKVKPDLKFNTHLPLEYDCCSNCNEKFPHRWTWSNTAFDEEREDNYSTFLPNNYKDIPGNTGPINNMFTQGGQLYLHTAESIWQQPRAYQERVTDSIVSYIGDGSFALPPKEAHSNINGSSAGLEYKFSSMTSKFGYFFVNLKEHTPYVFMGSVQPLNQGLTKYFNTHMVDMGKKYIDNHANQIGNGFHFGYDELNDRVLMTKNEFIRFDNTDHVYNNFYFDNWDNLTTEYAKQGYVFKRYIPDTNNTIQAEFIKFNVYPNKIKSDIISKEKMYVTGVKVPITDIGYEKSYTMSFSMKHKTWSSWHSYIPNQYLYTTKKIYSVEDEDSKILQHNVPYEYQQYKDRQYPFIVEYVDPGINPLLTSISESISYISDASQYDVDTNEWVDVDKTFTQAVLYNTKQCSGVLNLVIKNQEGKFNYIEQQVVSRQDAKEALVERHERNWYLNGFRDMSIKDRPIWNYNFDYASDFLLPDNIKQKYIDKVLNLNAIDYQKDWTEQEMLRDKYLVVRLTFDDKDSKKTKLLFNYTFLNDSKSER